MDKTAQFYSRPSYSGGGFPVFSGARRQRGGSVFGSIKRFFVPAVDKGKAAIAPKAMKEGLGFAKDMVGSFFRGKNMSQAAAQHGKKRAMNVAHHVANTGLNALDGQVNNLEKRWRDRARKRKAALQKLAAQRTAARKAPVKKAPVKKAPVRRQPVSKQRGVKRPAASMQKRQTNKRRRLF